MVRFFDKTQISEISSNDIIPITDISDSSNDKKISISQLQTYIESNATNFAEKNLSNTNMLTDAILTAPNGVIVANSSNNAIVAKNGLQLLFADGRNADGSFKSISYTLSEDKTQSVTTLSDNEYVLFLTNSGTLSYATLNQVYVSRTQPTVSTSTAYWYDILTNYWKRTTNTGSTWSNITINALGQFTVASGLIVNIVPNTVVYIPNPEALMVRDASNITPQGKENIKSYIGYNNLANVSLSNIDSSGEDVIKTLSQTVINNNLYTGTIIWFGKNSAPIGYLVCDGSAVNRTQFSALFNVIGITFGSGDGSTTFNLPNLIGYAPKGSNTVGTYTNATSTSGTSSWVDNHVHSYVAGVGGSFTTGVAGGHNHTYSYLTDVARLTLLPCIKY